MIADFPAPRVIGHRGAAMYAPENTLAGFRKAKELGAQWVEFDVQATRDGMAVLMHDARIERTTNGRGFVAERTMHELDKLDAGSWFDRSFCGEGVPSLVRTLGLLSEEGLGAMIEVKAGPGDGPRTMAAVLRVLDGMELRVPATLASFDEAALAYAAAEKPEVPRALGVGRVPDDWEARLARFKCAALHAGDRGLSESTIAMVAAKIPLRVYTVNAPARAEALFGWGVAAVFTDCPDVIISAVGHRSGGPVETSPRRSSQK
jgi:glycerophosphoryl diester phosphodiesterase